MFRALFIATVLITLLVNIIFLLATRERAISASEHGPGDEATAATMALLSSPVDGSISFSSALVVAPSDFDQQTPPSQTSTRSRARETGQVSTERLHERHGIFSRSNRNLIRDDDESSPPVHQSNGPGMEQAKRKRRWRIAEPNLRDSQNNNSNNNNNNNNNNNHHFLNSPVDKQQQQQLTSQKDGLPPPGGHLDSAPRLGPAPKEAESDDKNLSRPGRTGEGSTGEPSGQNSRQLNIRVRSSKDQVLISVDGTIIYQSGRLWLSGGRQQQHPLRARHTNGPNESSSTVVESGRPTSSSSSTSPSTSPSSSWRSEDRLRGIHVVVLSQFDGSVMAKRIFDTYTPGQDDQLCLFLRQLARGRLVIFAVEDEASFKMAPQSQARKLLKSPDWASEMIGHLRWRDMWTFVARFGGHKTRPGKGHLDELRATNLAERMTKSSGFQEWAPDCELEVRVELEPEQGALEQLDCFRRQLSPQTRPSSSSLGHNRTEYEEEEDEDKDEYEEEGLGRRAGFGSCEADLERRIEFCSRVEGYGRVCDCQYPAPISFPATGPPFGAADNFRMASVPIVVIASNRPYYLYRMLRSLLQTNGLNSSLVTIVIDGFYDEPVEVAKLFNLRAVQQAPMGQRSARISHHYKTSLALTFERLHPQAEFVLILEEDLDVAQDALVYFNQTIGLLERDPSLYCASAWNDQGYEHSVGRDDRHGQAASRVQRLETMPGLGWLLSRRLFLEELEPKWPSFEQPHDWDMWIRTGSVRRGRECLIPEVSRTYHFGSLGTNINSYFQRQYFSKHAFNLTSNISGQEFARSLENLEQSRYERLLDQLLGSSRILTRPTSLKEHNSPKARQMISDEQYLCSLADTDHDNKLFLDNNNNNNSGNHNNNNNINSTQSEDANNNIVIYIKMINQEDYANWLRLAGCWHLWDLDARGQHKSMWRLHLKGRQLFVVGSPASPYSRRHKPASLEPFDLLANGSSATSANPAP